MTILASNLLPPSLPISLAPSLSLSLWRGMSAPKQLYKRGYVHVMHVYMRDRAMKVVFGIYACVLRRRRYFYRLRHEKLR